MSSYFRDGALVLETSDRVLLADGVELRGLELVDRVAATTWPLNHTAAFVVLRCGRPLGEVADEVADAFHRPRESARHDVLAFAWALNRHALANVERSRRRLGRLRSWLQVAGRLAPTGTLPPLVARRRAIDTSTWLRAFATASAAAARRGALVATATFAAVAHLGLVAGEVLLAAPLAAGVAVGGGLVVHEASHAVALVGIRSALVVHGRRTFLLHAPTSRRRRLVVAGAGPLVASSLGVALLAAASPLGAPLLALAGGAAATHAVGLTVLTSDGRAACGL